MTKDFLLYNQTAISLYNDVQDLPIIDYHCHLSIGDILENKPFENISQLWLSADHYKWRLMRMAGVEEHYITGDASDYQKFEKYLQTLIYAIGSPLYHWSKMELSKYFDVEDELIPENISSIYEKANRSIAQKQLTPQKILLMSNVEKVCIVEDAQNCDLSLYKKVKELNLKTSISPIIRLDNLVKKSLSKIKEIFNPLLRQFIQVGCVSADIGLEHIDENDADAIEKLSYLLDECYKNNLVVQIHLGPMRNNNQKMFNVLGADSGFDSISEKRYLCGLRIIFNNVQNIGKTIIFNLNPADNAKIITFAGNFAGDGIKGKVQPGVAWWFNDHLDGIKEFFKAVSNMYLLSASVGMLTDSRSFLSYTRHDYFRRILCNYIGDLSEKGQFTKNYGILKKIAQDISYNNVKEFFD
jgi:glucuronate isomerase